MKTAANGISITAAGSAVLPLLDKVDDMLSTLQLAARLEELRTDYMAQWAGFDLPALEYTTDESAFHDALGCCRQMLCIASHLLQRQMTDLSGDNRVDQEGSASQ